MTRFRKIIGQIHLWLGLITGLVVLIVSITGCLFVFQKEISDLIHQETFFVKPPSSTVTLPYSTLLKKAEQALGKDHPVNFSTTYKDKEHAWEFMTYKAGDPKALTYFGSIDYYESVFINPYTGAVTGLRDYKYNFFNIVKFIHWSLLLNDTYGQNIVGYSTLIFVFMLVTGMIMWWPKKWSKTNINKSFKVKWKAGFKRVVYDLHNVSGFYVMLITLVLALTGMVFAFKWFQTTVYVVASGSTTPPEVKQVKSKPAPAVLYPVDIAFNKAKVLLPASDRINVSPAAGAEGVIYIYGIKGKETYYHADALQFDQYSGKLLYRRNYEEQNAGEKLVGMNYDIHVGAILGLPGKIIAFIASLVGRKLTCNRVYDLVEQEKEKKEKIDLVLNYCFLSLQPRKGETDR